MQIYNSTTEQTASVKEDVIQHDRSFHSVMEDWGTAGPETAEVGGTYRLQLVHEFDQELSALWRFTVQLHACLHSIEPACRTGEERWKENRIKPLFYCSVNSIPLQPRSKVWLSHAEDSLHRVLMNLSLRGGRPPPPRRAADVSISSTTDQTQTHSGAGGRWRRRFPPEPPQASTYREDSLSELQLPQSLICQLVLQSDSSLHMM